MNVTTITTGTSTQTQTSQTNGRTTYKIEMLDDGAESLISEDDDDDIISTDGSMYADGDLATIAVNDDVAHQLAAAGPVGVAAAAAIASSKKRKRPHSFETNPSVRKRQQNRLLRKLRGIIYEFTGRVGKQAVVLVATPGKPNTSYKVFGAKPLEDVVRNLKNIVMDELENALAQQAPPPPQEDPTLFELPGLVIDGIPTPVEKMTQAQLRAFIPLMLKYSTGRGKPGWGRESTRPPWWPKELPWANVRMDARSEDDKQKISWTHALRKIVVNCYKYHGREDLLPTFADDDDKVNALISQSGDEDEDMIELPTTATIQSVQTVANATTNTANYGTQTVFSQNADGTVSLIQVDPNNPIITLPDGTTAQVQGVATLHQGEGGATIQTVQSLADVNGHDNMTVDLTEATVGQDGQIFITTEDGQGYPVSVSNVISVPVSMYQSMMANVQQIHPNDGTVCIAPMQVDSTIANNNNNNNSVNNNNNTNNNNTIQCYPLFSALNANQNHRNGSVSGSSNSSISQIQYNNNNNNNSNSNSNTNNSTNNNNNSSSQTNHHQQQQLQNKTTNTQQQQSPRIFIAANTAGFSLANLAAVTSNNNNNNNSNNNNNNNNNNSLILLTQRTNNGNIGSNTMGLTLGTANTAGNANLLSTTTSSTTTNATNTGTSNSSSSASAVHRRNHKRRKQNLLRTKHDDGAGSAVGVGVSGRSGISLASAAGARLLNIQFADGSQMAALAATLPAKTIKLENFDAN